MFGTCGAHEYFEQNLLLSREAYHNLMCGGDGQACTETLFFDPSKPASGVASAVLCAVASGVAPAVPLNDDFAQSENVRLEVLVIRCGG